MSKEKLGRGVFFSFFFAYALLQVPAGWLSDTLGARRMLALYVAVWSLATMSMGSSTAWRRSFSYGSCWAFRRPARILTAASVIKRWFPYGSRGRASSAVSMGGRAGGLLAFAITPSLLLVVGALLGWETGRVARSRSRPTDAGAGVGLCFRLALSRLASRAPLVQCRRSRPDRARLADEGRAPLPCAAAARDLDEPRSPVDVPSDFVSTSAGCSSSPVCRNT